MLNERGRGKQRTKRKEEVDIGKRERHTAGERDKHTNKGATRGDAGVNDLYRDPPSTDDDGGN